MTDKEFDFLIQETVKKHEERNSFAPSKVYRVLWKGKAVISNSGKSVWPTKGGATRALNECIESAVDNVAYQTFQNKYSKTLFPTYKIRLAGRQDAEDVTFDSVEQSKEFIKKLTEIISKNFSIQELS